MGSKCSDEVKELKIEFRKLQDLIHSMINGMNDIGQMVSVLHNSKIAELNYMIEEAKRVNEEKKQDT